METTRISNVNLLKPVLKKRVLLVMEDAKKEGLEIDIYETLRTKERQEWLYSFGRTKEGKILTKTLESKHLTGEAVDIVFWDGLKWSRDPENDWKKLDEICKKNGLKRPLGWDLVHYELDTEEESDTEEEKNKFEILKEQSELKTKEYRQIFDLEVTDPVFTKHEGDSYLPEKTMKHLIEIGLRRDRKRQEAIINSMQERIIYIDEKCKHMEGMIAEFEQKIIAIIESDL